MSPLRPYTEFDWSVSSANPPSSKDATRRRRFGIFGDERPLLRVRRRAHGSRRSQRLTDFSFQSLSDSSII